MSVLDAIGNTPLVEITNLWNSAKTGVRIMAKLEGSNPGGSVKDRPAYFMLSDSQRPVARFDRRSYLPRQGRSLPFDGGLPFNLRHMPAVMRQSVCHRSHSILAIDYLRKGE